MPGGTAVDWRSAGEGCWSMSLSGASDPIVVRVVGFVVRVQQVLSAAGEQSTQFTLRSAVANGWNMARNILDNCSVDSPRMHFDCPEVVKLNHIF